MLRFFHSVEAFPVTYYVFAMEKKKEKKNLSSPIRELSFSIIDISPINTSLTITIIDNIVNLPIFPTNGYQIA